MARSDRSDLLVGFSTLKSGLLTNQVSLDVSHHRPRVLSTGDSGESSLFFFKFHWNRYDYLLIHAGERLPDQKFHKFGRLLSESDDPPEGE